ncbi:MAG: CvpA family protein [Bacteroidetes bacterium]|uniref:CvpA family protein n=1 Tax=Candidatus Cryptobacteroides merdigallinarum TaxID=2840770 RepID=A0A9D9HCE6_9BACT|nr:CvpA family protein [Candidatus Cryptobacteroides merdigallinarum]
MNILDIVLLACLIPAVIQGLRKGFIAQVVAIISLILGGWLAYRFSSALTGWLGQWIEAPAAAMNIISFIIIFAIVVTLLFLLGKILEASIKIILLGWLNRLLGLIFALFKYVLVLGLLTVLFDSINGKFNIVQESYLSSSVMYSGFRSIAYSIFPYLKSLF